MRVLDYFRVLGDQLLVSLDGTTYFSSQTIHCPHCLTRQLANDRTLYYHPVILGCRQPPIFLKDEPPLPIEA